MSHKGKLIECLVDKSISTALCVDENKNKLLLLSPENKEFSLKATKTLYVSKASLNVDKSRDSLVEEIQSRHRRRESIKEDIDIRELWEVLVDEEDPQYGFRELGEIYFSTDTGDDEVAAMLRCLRENSEFFRYLRQKKVYIPNSPDEVEKRLQQKRARKERRERIALIGDWMRAVYQGEEPPSLGEELEQQVLDELRRGVLDEESGKYPSPTKEYLGASGLDDHQAPFQILVARGVFSPDENLPLLQLEVPVEFSPKVLEAAEELSRRFPEVMARERDRRSTYREATLYAVDADETQDRDDAISIEYLDSGDYRLGIHVSDVSEFIPPMSFFDGVAAERVTSIYMPDLVVNMLPSKIVEDIFSLDQGKERLALSLFAVVTDEGEVKRTEFKETIIEVDEALNYDEADEKISQGDRDLATFHKLAQAFMACRMEGGGQDIFFPFYEVFLEDGEVHLKGVSENSAAQFTIAEIMILANGLAGAYLSRLGVPAVFRSQPVPKEFTPMKTVSYLNLFRIRKYLKRTSLVSSSSRHFTLGLDEYIQSTSPIRRYTDLINQYQIKSAIRQDGGYDEKEVVDLIQKMDMALGHARTIGRRRRAYWVFKYLQQFEGEKLPAYVLHNFSNKLLVQLHQQIAPRDEGILQPHLWETTVAYRAKSGLPPGTWIWVKVVSVDPHGRRISVRFIGKIDQELLPAGGREEE